MGFFSFVKKLFKRTPPSPPKKLGLALGSGGAKGMAHLGALKAFDEEGIRFDVVTGTSIGSIIGGLYARGYSYRDTFELFKRISFIGYLRYLRPHMDMQPFEELLDSYFGGAEIADLKIPYACWATDERTNEGVVITSGNAAKACCASSAMPPFFKSVRIGANYLLDGAFTNAIPSDVAKSLGADFVIGIELSSPRYKKNDPPANDGTFFGVLKKMLTGDMPKEIPTARTRGYENSDILLEPNLHDFKPTDISSEGWEKMFEEGYTEAKLRMPEIKALLKQHGFVLSDGADKNK